MQDFHASLQVFHKPFEECHKMFRSPNITRYSFFQQIIRQYCIRVNLMSSISWRNAYQDLP
jgi:hypothetical protein